MNCNLNRKTTRIITMAAFSVWVVLSTARLHAESVHDFAPDARAGETVGHGDGRIHIIPSLSRPSLKNGEKMTISAVIKAAAGIKSVTADIGGLETITLKPTAQNLGGINALGSLGMWSAEWTGHSLEEKYYTVALKVVDNEGHEYQDRTLQFSDPVAGLMTMGTTNYPVGGLNRIGSGTVNPSEENLNCAVIDVLNGYAYFGCNISTSTISQGVIIKVALGRGNAAPVRTSSVVLPSGENHLTCAVIDPAAGYAYFGGYQVVVKISLGAGASPPSRIGNVVLNSSEYYLTSAVIDTASGYAYFATQDIYYFYQADPAVIVQVSLGAGNALPTRTGSLTLNTGESNVYAAVFDPTSGIAYFGTSAAIGTPTPLPPATVIKIQVRNFVAPNVLVRVGSVTLNAGETSLGAAVIDHANGYAYFGTNNSPASIVQIQLGADTAPPIRVGALVLTESSLISAVADLTNGCAYFGTNTNPGLIVKVKLGTTTTLPTKISTLTTANSSEAYLASAVVDEANGVAFFGAFTVPGTVVKIGFGTVPSTSAAVEIGSVTLGANESYLGSAVIDTQNGYAYFGNLSSATGAVIKVSLGSGNNPPVRVGTAVFASGEVGLTSAVIDPGNGYAYFGTNTVPGIVVKVALGSGNSPPSRVNAVTLNSGENYLTSAAIDTANQVAYFGTYTQPGNVVAVKLGAGTAAPTRASGLLLNTGEDSLQCGVIDTLNGYAYFGTATSPGLVVKLKLFANGAQPQHLGTLTLLASEFYPKCAVIDPAAGYAYFGTTTTTGGTRTFILDNTVHTAASTPTPAIVKISLGIGSAAPTRTGVVLSTGGTPACAAIDSSAGYAYFGTDTGVMKVSLGSGASLPTITSTLSAIPAEAPFNCAAIDPSKGFIYFGNNPRFFPATYFTKYGISEGGALKGTRTQLLDDATLTNINFYSHTATGNVRLCIYDNSTPKKLMWYSNAAAPNVVNGTITVPISSGTPSVLSLPAGTYWLGWQTDTNASVASYSEGALGDGFYLYQPFGTFPSALGSETLSDERWTEYITYSLKPSFKITGSSTQTAGVAQTITLSALDNTGTPVSTYNGARTIVFSGANTSLNPATAPMAGGTPFGTSFSVNFVNGIASVSMNLYKSESAVISAFDAAANVTTATPLNVNVAVASLDHFALSVPLNTQSAGQSQVLTITAQDPFGNTVTSYAGAKAVVFSGANSSPTPVTAPTAAGVNFGSTVNVSFTSGVATVTSMTLYNAETAMIDVAASTIHASPKLAMTVAPQVISKFAISGMTNQTAGTTQSIIITAQDTYGNTATSYTSAIDGLPKFLVFNGAGVSANANAPNVAGVTLGTNVPLYFNNGTSALTALTLYKDEPAAIVAQSGIFGTPQPLSVNVTAGPTGALSLTGNGSQARGTPFNITVSAFDGFGNIQGGYTGTVSFTCTDATAQLPGNYTFISANAGTKAFSTTFNTAGSQLLTVIDGTNSKSLVVAVGKSTPGVTWPNPASIDTLTPLSATQLNAAANGGLAGSYLYSPALGSYMNAGNGQPLTVAFTPFDSVNYIAVAATVNINVSKGTPVISWTPSAGISYPAPLSATQLNAIPPVNVAGSIVYSPPAGTVLTAGNGQILSAQFTPDDTTNYNTPPAKTVSINVAKGTPVITWTPPGAIGVGTPLSTLQLNAAANIPNSATMVPGSFNYAPLQGVILPIGNGQPLTAQFMPADTANYNTPPVATVFINVIPANGGTPPTAKDLSYSVNENQTLTVPAPGILKDATDQASLPLSAVLYGPKPANGTLTLSTKPDGSFTYTPNPLFNGTDTFQYQASNGTLVSTPQTVTITVKGVNQAPSFSLSTNPVVVRADGGQQLVPNFATNISAGAPNESAQTLTFNLSAYDATLFDAPPMIASNGALSFTPNPSRTGTVTVNVTLTDSGVTANGGTDTSASQTFPIIINRAPPVLPGVQYASGMVGAPFSRKLNASGGAPITYSYIPSVLPAGLTLIGDQITGMPLTAGQTKTAMTASNGVSPASIGSFNFTAVDTLYISTVAGGPLTGYSGVTQPATLASLSAPAGVAVDSDGNLYIADQGNNCIRKVDTFGNISTVAGQGKLTGDGILATAAQLNSPRALAVDGFGNLYVCEPSGVRKITKSTGLISTIAIGGFLALKNPTGIAVDALGNVFIADETNQRVVKVNNNQLATIFAGGGTTYGDGGAAIAAKLNGPFGVAVDAGGKVYIADVVDQVLRVVDTAGKVSTRAGKLGIPGLSGDGGPAAAALLTNPQGVTVDGSGNIYISDTGNNRLMKILTDDTIVTLAGATGIAGNMGDKEPSFRAQLNQPSGVCAAGNVVYVADQMNNRIRLIGPPVQPSFASAPTASSNPVEVTKDVVFMCAANGTPQPSLKWDFGDGIGVDTSNSSTPKYAYKMHGTYTVTVTATSPLGTSTSATMVETVSPGTRVPAEIMKALNLSLDDPNASPLGPDDATELSKIKNTLTVQISGIKLFYVLKNKDSMLFKMSFPIQGNPTTNGQKLVLDFGGVTKVFILKQSGSMILATDGNKNDVLMVKIVKNTMMLSGSFVNNDLVDTLKTITGFGENDNPSTMRDPAMNVYALYAGYLYYVEPNLPTTYIVNPKTHSGSGKSR